MAAPGATTYSDVKTALLRQFERSPRDLARDLRELRSIGDRTPTQIVQLMRRLLPGIPDNPLFEVVLLDLLPENAKVAALRGKTLDEMAAAADLVVAENAVNVVAEIKDAEFVQAVRPAARPAAAPRSAKDLSTKLITAKR